MRWLGAGVRVPLVRLEMRAVEHDKILDGLSDLDS